MSQFGIYHRQNKQLRLATGDTLTVYRVKYWRFANREPPALQLEYEPPFTVADTAHARRFARQVWPAFAPYVESMGLRSAIITATNLRRRGFGYFGSAHMEHFGIIARRDSVGQWHMGGEATPLPAAEREGPLRIYEPNGQLLAAPPVRLDEPTEQMPPD